MRLLLDQDLNQMDWDSALLAQTHPSLLQSWGWGEFQKSIGHQVWRVAAEDNGKIVTQLLLIKQSLGLGQSIIYSPRGQLLVKHLPAKEAQATSALLISHIQKLAHQEHCILFRIDPPTLAEDHATNALYRQLGFVSNPRKEIQPQYNQILDLSQGAGRTLNQAKPKTRYNINLAHRHNLQVTTETTDQAIAEFLNLLDQTSQRKSFTSHRRHYLESQVRFLTNLNMADLITVTLREPTGASPLASIFVVYFGQTATYLHGASSNNNRQLMAPYLAHEHAIELAAERGMDRYDLGGVHPNPGHKWSGITRFKQGFGGSMIKYVGTLELPLNPWWYRFYRFTNLIR